MAAPTLIDEIEGLSPRQRALCRRAGIYSAEQLLVTSISTLVKQLHVERAEATLINRLAAVSLGAPSTSAFHLLTGRKQPEAVVCALPTSGAEEASSPGPSQVTRSNDLPRAALSLLSTNGFKSRYSDAVAATQGADDPLSQPGTRPTPQHGFISKIRSMVPWQTRLGSADVVPGSQGSELGDDGLDASDGRLTTALHPDPEVVAVGQRSPSPKALGKRKAEPLRIEQPHQRHKRRLIETAPEQDEDDLSSMSDGTVDHLQDEERERSTLTPADIQIARSRVWLSTGDSGLDRILGGGLRRGTITEVVGESSSGKTQLALQIAVHTVLGVDYEAASTAWSCPNRPRGVAILTPHGETAASSVINRLVELAKAFPRDASRFGRNGERRLDQSLDTDPANKEVPQHVARVLRNVHVACLQDADALDHALAYTLPGLQDRLRSSDSPDLGPLELVIVDGLPAFLQENAAGQNVYQNRSLRAKLLCSIADRLRALCVSGFRARSEEATHKNGSQELPSPLPGLAVLTVNHVTDAFERETAIVRAVLQEGHIAIHDLQIGVVHDELKDTWSPTLAIAAESATTPPLAFDLQSLHSSGVLSTLPSSVGAAGVRSHRDASGQDMPIDLDDYARALKGRLKLAQLGNVWTNCINARLVLSRTARRVPISIIPDCHLWSPVQDTDKTSRKKAHLRVLPVRRASLAFSPFAPSGIVSGADTDYVVTSSRGFRSIAHEWDLDRLSLTQNRKKREEDSKGAADDPLDALFTDFDDDAQDELERMAFDLEMDAALASIPDHEPEETHDAVPSSSAPVHSGVVPASSLPLDSGDGTVVLETS
ncbi:hypothetical protein V8E36_002590 [Tilletia maclaganii]